MRLGEGSAIHLRNASETVSSYLRRLSMLEDVKVITKPSVTPVLLRGVVKSLCLPPLTIISNADIALEHDITSLKIAEKCWVDCSAVNIPRVLEVAEAIAKNKPSLAFTDRYGEVRLEPAEAILLRDYVRAYLNERHLAFLPNLRNVSVNVLSAEPWYLWSNHPVVYGIRELIKFGSLPAEWDCVCLNEEPPKKLLMLSRPLLYVGNRVLLAELPFNSSIVFACMPSDGRLMEELIIRSVLYVVGSR